MNSNIKNIPSLCGADTFDCNTVIVNITRT